MDDPGTPARAPTLIGGRRAGLTPAAGSFLEELQGLGFRV